MGLKTNVGNDNNGHKRTKRDTLALEYKNNKNVIVKLRTEINCLKDQTLEMVKK